MGPKAVVAELTLVVFGVAGTGIAQEDGWDEVQADGVERKDQDNAGVAGVHARSAATIGVQNTPRSKEETKDSLPATTGNAEGRIEWKGSRGEVVAGVVVERGEVVLLRLPSNFGPDQKKR